MIRKISLLCTGAIVGATAMTAVYNVHLSHAEAASSQTYRQLSIFGDIFERVRGQYVTPPDDKELVRAAINGMLTSLDPHSSYLDPESAQEMRNQTKGEFGGLGIEITMEDELVKVIAPIDDTPAMRAGVLSGDLIAEIDGEQVRGMTLDAAIGLMRGKVGDPIEIKVLREGFDEPIEFKIVRAKIKNTAVKARVEGGDVGYIKLITFSEIAYDDMVKEIEKIKAEVPADKLKGYIIDLRLNGGGLLDQAVSISDAFLDRGEIVSTRGRNEKDITRFDSRPGDVADGKPIIVLVNGGSASASEIVAGALKDHHRATIVGTRSFGKGSVQTIIPMGENGALRLTTALYYTPSGTSIQGTGVTPDIITQQPLPDELKGKNVSRGESNLKGHIKGEKEDENGSGSSVYVPREAKDDLQLQEALKLMRGETTNAAFPPNPDEASLKQ